MAGRILLRSIIDLFFKGVIAHSINEPLKHKIFNPVISNGYPVPVFRPEPATNYFSH
jgi:hypothetical protein